MRGRLRCSHARHVDRCVAVGCWLDVRGWFDVGEWVEVDRWRVVGSSGARCGEGPDSVTLTAPPVMGTAALGGAEDKPFTEPQFMELLGLAKKGVAELTTAAKEKKLAMDWTKKRTNLDIVMQVRLARDDSLEPGCLAAEVSMGRRPLPPQAVRALLEEKGHVRTLEVDFQRYIGARIGKLTDGIVSISCRTAHMQFHVDRHHEPKHPADRFGIINEQDANRRRRHIRIVCIFHDQRSSRTGG